MARKSTLSVVWTANNQQVQIYCWTLFPLHRFEKESEYAAMISNCAYLPLVDSLRQEGGSGMLKSEIEKHRVCFFAFGVKPA